MRGKYRIQLFIVIFSIFIAYAPLFAQSPTIELSATGQETQYNGQYDDGYYQKGLAAPTPRFTDNGDGTITDEHTGLVWLQNGDCSGGSTDWDTAFTYIDELNSSGTMNSNNCGDVSNGGAHQSDWRFPNVLELESLLNLEQANNATWLKTQGFLNIPGADSLAGDYSERYFSSTSYAGTDNVDHVWHVQITEARVRHEDKTVNYYVWAVRGGE